MNKDGFVKLDDKTLKESIDNLQGTQFLDAFCVLTHIKVCKEENTNLKQALNDIRETIVFCINDMKNEYACTDKRTNRELHTMVKILSESLQIINEALGDDDSE